MPKPVPGDILDSFKEHARIRHTRDDDLIESVYLPAAIAKVVRTTDVTEEDALADPPTIDDWEDGLALLVVFRIAAAMYEAREVNISVQPFNSELMSVWNPSA